MIRPGRSQRLDDALAVAFLSAENSCKTSFGGSESEGRALQRQPVRSSNVASVGYDPTSRVLEVEFHSGGVYRYLNVPEGAYQALLSAPSVGSYLNAKIKDRYRFRKIAG